MENPNPSILIRALFGVLNETLENLQKVAFFSNQIFPSVTETIEAYNSKTLEEIAELLSSLDENSLPEEYIKVLNLFEKIPNVKAETLDNIKENSLIIEFCSHFKALNDLLQLKISTLSSKSLFEIQKSESCSQEKNKELQSELERLKKEVEVTRAKKKETILENSISNEPESYGLSAEDFQSQHPFFIKTNAEEQIEFIKSANEIKLTHLRKKQEQSEETLKDAMLKNKSELWKIIEETMQTHIFVDWVKDINRDKMKAHEEEQKELWKNFSNELLECRTLCLKNREMDTEYNEIMKEKREKKAEKQLAAVIILQAHLRGYLTRKEYGVLKSPALSF